GVLPRDPSVPADLLAAGVSWSRPSDGSSLRSSALRANTSGFPDAEIAAAIDSSDTQQWSVIKFSALGTTLNSGDLVLAPLRALSPAAASSPVQFANPDRVCGLSLGSYGLASLVDGRAGF
ncbi:MAG TPA: hypothetical protein VFJ90_05395, partial [Candidatus Didemnitutus sp.]|nr:hypothetical protein [Candidatus Didemnitutus sp.]